MTTDSRGIPISLATAGSVLCPSCISLRIRFPESRNSFSSCAPVSMEKKPIARSSRLLANSPACLPNCSSNELGPACLCIYSTIPAGREGGEGGREGGREGREGGREGGR